eukprot:6990789-Ditylum_brightwellii.AAC.1
MEWMSCSPDLDSTERIHKSNDVIALCTPYWRDLYGLLNVRILQRVWIALCTCPVRFNSNPFGFNSRCPAITYQVMSDGFKSHSWWTQLIQFALNSRIQTL